MLKIGGGPFLYFEAIRWKGLFEGLRCARKYNLLTESNIIVKCIAKLLYES